ncbi:MAG: DUF4003 domain-containing protein [Eubacterium sp.]|nr:DUF4003 domain-containing protein [Eubacterium sp.]
MKENIKNKVDLLVANKEKIEKEFKWGYSLMHIAAALVFTAENKEADIERIKECRKILKKNTGTFSSFQSDSEAVIVSKMALADNPEQYIRDVKHVYDILNKKHTFEDSYLIQGAICIYEAGRMDEAEFISGKFMELYKKMEKKHPFLTSSEDIVYVVLLAMTDKDVDTIFNEIEECYIYLKKDINLKVGNDELHGLGEILALTDGDIKEKSDKVVNLYNTILDHGVKWGKEYNEFGSLGTLIDIDVDNNILVDEIVEVSDYLKRSKGFSDWTLDNKQRLMFSAMLVGDSYSENRSLMSSSAVSSTVAMVIAEEVALMMCMMLCVTAATTVNT